MIRTVLNRLRELKTSAAAQGAGIAFGARAGGAAAALLFHVLLARLTGPAGYGAYGVAVAWTKVLAVLAGLGLPEAIVRFVPEYRERDELGLLRGLVKGSQWAVSGMSLIIGGLGLLGLWGWTQGGGGIFLQDASPLVRALAVGLCFLPLISLLRLSKELCRSVDRIAAAYVLPRLGRPAFMIAALLCYSTWASSSLSGSGAVALMGVSILPVWLLQLRSFYGASSVRAINATSEVEWSPSRWWRVAGPLLLVSGFHMAIRQTDLVVVGLLLNTEAAGTYKAALTLARPAGFVLTAVNAVAAPRFSQVYASDTPSTLRPFVARIAHWLFWPTLLLAIGIGGLGPALLSVFGSGFADGYVPLIVLLGSHVVNAGTGSVGYLLNMTGHHTDTARVHAIVAVANVGFSVIGAWTAGLVGAALATTASTLLWYAWLHTIVRRRLGVAPSIVSTLRSRYL